MDFGADAALVAAAISDFGNAITLPSGVTERAIVEESAEKVAAAAPGELPDANGGKLVLFYCQADTAALSGDLISYDPGDGKAVKYALHAPSQFAAGGLIFYRTFIGVAASKK